jgi:cytochrome c peroxidase
MGLTSPARVSVALERLRSDARYPAWFTRAFPDVPSFTLTEVFKALAAFQRTLISGDSPFDKYSRGDRSAMSIEAIRGRFLFLDHEKGVVCHHCHDGPFFTNEGRWDGKPFDEIVFTNIGLYNVGGTGDYPSGLQGLFETTRNPDDRGKFRTPTLRNVAVTAPYMHDGSVETLQDVIDIYAEGGRNVVTGPHAGDGRMNPVKDRGLGPMRLTEVERAQMRAFLEALTDQSFLQDPRFSNPFPFDSDFGE